MANEMIPVAAPIIGEREREYVLDALQSGWVSSIGPYLDRFEQGFARYVGVEHAIAVSNGTVAIHLALHALGIGPGDEVIVPDLTFAATAHTVMQAGATPVLVDVQADTGCMDPAAVERAITPRTRAILTVHLYGHPADVDALSRIAAARGIELLEDAAEAHGATWNGRQVGSFGHVGTFSFYGNKLMTTGEGGMVVTNDGRLAHRMRFLKDHGMAPGRRYFHTEVAFNYRMTNLQAALGCAQLEQLESFIARRRNVFEQYASALAGTPGVTLNVERPGTRNVFWMVCAVLQAAADGRQGGAPSRDEVAARLREGGVDTRPFFIPLSEMPHLANARRVDAQGNADCPVARELSRNGLNLPSGCALTDAQVRTVAKALRAALDRRG